MGPLIMLLTILLEYNIAFSIAEKYVNPQDFKTYK